MFELENNIYDLRYTLNNVQIIEKAVNKPLIQMLQTVPTIIEARIIIGNALYNEHGNAISKVQGLEVANKIIEKYGLVNSYRIAVEKIMEDCAFLFR